MNKIKEIIEGKLGLSTLSEYEEYKKRISEMPVSLDEIEELSPDVVDSSEFWKYCDENPEFKLDTVSFGVTKEKSIYYANSKNFCLAAEAGVFSRMIQHRECAFNILDIGAGFGMLKYESKGYAPFSTYYGVDVHPKFEGCIKVNDCILPPEIMEKKFGIVVACNVFQHLSVRQRRSYYEQVAKICNGYFILTNVCDVPNSTSKGFRCRDNDRQYMVHYGQFTMIQTLDETVEDLKKHFTLLSVQQRLADNLFCFHLIPKQPIKNEEKQNE